MLFLSPTSPPDSMSRGYRSSPATHFNKNTMKNFYVSPAWVLFLFLPLTATAVYGQSLGIGTTTPNGSAILDLGAPGQGLLIPRMNSADITAIANPAKGLMVYDSVNNQLMINMGSPSASNWKVLTLSNPWMLKGNSGTNPAVDFIGTSDDHALNFRMNKIKAGSIDSAWNNSFFGFRSGDNAAAGSGNTGFGYYALDSNTLGSGNTAFGESTLLGTNGPNSLYGRNTAIGAETLQTNKLQSTAVGAGALSFITSYVTGNPSEAFGYGAFGSRATQGTAFGYQAMGLYDGNISPTGGYGLAIGNAALGSNVDGNAIAIGSGALLNDRSPSYNIAIGDSALLYSESSMENIALGSGANLTGSGNYNTAIGAEALYFTDQDSNSVGIGYQAGAHGGEHNTIAGYKAHAVYSGINTSENTAIGSQALYGNVFGNRNTALGIGAMQLNGGGYDNVAIGADAMYNNSEGLYNVAVGINALYSNRFPDNSIIGNQNTAIGANTLFSASRCLFSTVIGYNAGFQYDANYRNTIIGANCDIGMNRLTNCTAIGQAVTCTASNQVRIGNPATGSIGGFSDWGVVSDGRMKRDIKTQSIGLGFIMRLRPVTYQLDLNALDAHINHGAAKMTSAADQHAMAQREHIRHTGFVAQEVEEAASKAGYDFSGLEKPASPSATYGLRYSNFVSPIVRALQEQQQAIRTLQADQASVINMVAAQETLYDQILAKLNSLEGKPDKSKN
jgi:hypothetical protein